MNNIVEKTERVPAIDFSTFRKAIKNKNMMRMIKQSQRIPQVRESDKKIIIREKYENILNLKSLTLASGMNNLIEKSLDLKIYAEQEKDGIFLTYENIQIQLFAYLGRNLYLKSLGFSVNDKLLTESTGNLEYTLVQVTVYS